MIEITEKKWIIVSKDRKVIAKGVPRSRELVLLGNTKDKQRILTYGSKKKAENGFLLNWFYAYSDISEYTPEDMEAIEVEINTKETKE